MGRHESACCGPIHEQPDHILCIPNPVMLCQNQILQFGALQQHNNITYNWGNTDYLLFSLGVRDCFRVSLNCTYHGLFGQMLHVVICTWSRKEKMPLLLVTLLVNKSNSATSAIKFDKATLIYVLGMSNTLKFPTNVLILKSNRSPDSSIKVQLPLPHVKMCMALLIVVLVCKLLNNIQN